MKLRWGILGAGRILAKFAAAFPLTRDAELVALASRDPERARQFKAPRIHIGYEALLADPEVDVVANTLHNGLHCEWTIRALEAGKHVLCEKPLACSVAEVDRMFAAARANGRWLLEGFMYRFHPQIAEAYRRVQDGEVGRVLHIRAHYATRGREADNPRYSREAGGGALLDVGCYGVNFVRLFAGAEPVRVSAHGHFADVDLTLAAQLDFPNDVTGHVLCSFESEGSYSAEVIGTAGKLLIPNPWLPPAGQGELIVTRAGKSESIPVTTPEWLTPFAAEIDHLSDCIRQNRAPQFPPGLDAETDSRGNMCALEMIDVAARHP